MAKAQWRVIDGGRMSDDNQLAELTQQAHELAIECRLLLKYESVEARRERYLAYGQVLLAIRDQFQGDDKGFGKHVHDNDLDAHDRQFRNHAMWLAENWSTVLPAIQEKGCEYASPDRIRQWYGEEQGTRKPRKRKTTSPIEPDTDYEEETVDEDVTDIFGKALAGLFAAIGEAAVNANTLQRILANDPTQYDKFKPDDFKKTFDAWDKLVLRMNKLKR